MPLTLLFRFKDNNRRLHSWELTKEINCNKMFEGINLLGYKWIEQSIPLTVFFSSTTRSLRSDALLESRVLIFIAIFKFRSKNIQSLETGKMFALLKGTERNVKIKLSLLAGKLSLEKKSLRFWMVFGFESKIGGKNLALCNGFVSSTVKVYIWYLARLCSKSENFFSGWQPYIVKK